MRRRTPVFPGPRTAVAAIVLAALAGPLLAPPLAARGRTPPTRRGTSPATVESHAAAPAAPAALQPAEDDTPTRPVAPGDVRWARSGAPVEAEPAPRVAAGALAASLGAPALVPSRIYEERVPVDAAELTLAAQLLLATLGYDVGAVDGSETPATRAAVRRFEIAQALPATGRVTGDLLVRLAERVQRTRTAR